MTKFLTAGGVKRTGSRLTVVVVLLGLLLLIMAGVASVWAPLAFSAAAPNDQATLLDGYRHVEVASVSDAIEKLSGQRMYMSHRMRPIFSSKFAGVALTVQLTRALCKACWQPSTRAGRIPCTSWWWRTAQISPA